jgi:hypothetical protein
LARWERGVAYGVVGMASEVVFTGARDGVFPRDWRLQGRSYVWMLPIYGLSRWVLPGGATRLDYAPLWAVAGLGLERVHDALAGVTVTGR